MRRLTVIDFFCGAGGFSEGFRQQGFAIICGIDNWAPAIETFNLNFGLHCAPRDVLEFEHSTASIETLPDADVIIGSPPCVSFSSSNRSGNASKALGLRLTKVFLRVVAVHKYKPGSCLKAWFMENVSNSIYHVKPHYTFKQLGLEIWAGTRGLNPDSVALEIRRRQSVVNSADFGVPQSRRRVFTGEILARNAPVFPKQTHRSPHRASSLPAHITLAHLRSHLPAPNSKPTRTRVVDPFYPAIRIPRIELTDHFYDTGLYTWDWKGSRFLKTNHPYMGPMAFPEREDRPSRTVLATNIGNSREAIVFKSERSRKGHGKYRTLTIREAATLMGFPVTFQFLGFEDTKWTLVGNAVCPPVSRAFAKVVRAALCLPRIPKPLVVRKVKNLQKVPNLNTFTLRRFNHPLRPRRGPRFRRHPFKYGNLTVTLSNYDIARNGSGKGKWRASIQYGTGAGFPIQRFPDNYFRKLTRIIKGFARGQDYLETINNGFSRKVAPANLLHHMHGTQRNKHPYLQPAELIDSLAEIIEASGVKNEDFTPQGRRLFKRQPIPKKQVLALYAITKICSIANREKA